jgi:hypothetical protein
MHVIVHNIFSETVLLSQGKSVLFLFRKFSLGFFVFQHKLIDAENHATNINIALNALCW